MDLMETVAELRIVVEYLKGNIFDQNYRFAYFNYIDYDPRVHRTAIIKIVNFGKSIVFNLHLNILIL